jgi:hypothetical protein
MAHPPRAAREASRHGAIGGSDALGAVDAQRKRERHAALTATRERKARQVEDSVRWAPKAAPAPALSRRAPPAGINMSTFLAEDMCGEGSSFSSLSRAGQMSRMAAPDRRRMAELLVGQGEVFPAEQPSRVLLHKPRWMQGGDGDSGLDVPPPRRTVLMDSRRAILEAAAAEETVGSQGAHPLDPARVGRPGGLWQGTGQPSHADKVHMAVAELRRRQPHLTEKDALQKVGVALAQELNASDAAARDYFKMRGRVGQ